MNLPRTTVSILVDDDRFYVSVRIDGDDFELGNYPNATEAGRAMVRWLDGRGLTTALGSGRRLSEAQRLGSSVITFEVERATARHH